MAGRYLEGKVGSNPILATKSLQYEQRLLE